MPFQHYVVTALLGIASVAHGQADSVVIRITSPRGTEVQFSGVITLKDNKTQRRFDRVSTPFEVKLPAQSIDARFIATDGGALSADLVTYRDGKQRGQVTGTMYVGEVKLYLEPGVAFGFGPRVARPLSP